MFWIVMSAAVLAGGVFAATRLRRREGHARAALRVTAASVAVAAALLVPSVLYAQDVGETAVVINLGGSVAGHTSDPGFHAKSPLQRVVRYDTRNNIVNFYGDADYDYAGGSAQGACVTVNDASGASADVDVQVVYSLDPDAAERLYEDCGTQTGFTQNYVSNDVRACVREVAGTFGTITMLTDRGSLTQAISDALSGRWADKGITVEAVNVQDVSYPEQITQSYAAAQAAEVAKAQAENEQETAKVEAETRRIAAEGEAAANSALNDSLTDRVIQQHYIDALNNAASNGCLVVVPEGSQPIVGTPGA